MTCSRSISPSNRVENRYVMQTEGYNWASVVIARQKVAKRDNSKLFFWLNGQESLLSNLSGHSTALPVK